MENRIKLLEKEAYLCPDLEIIDIETEQNILAGSSGEGSGGLDSMRGQDW